MSSQILVALPDDVANLLDPGDGAIQARVREALVLYLFEQEIISSGKGAELLAIPRHEFLDLLYKRGIPYFRQTIEEVLQDAGVSAAARAERIGG